MSLENHKSEIMHALSRARLGTDHESDPLDEPAVWRAIKSAVARADAQEQRRLDTPTGQAIEALYRQLVVHVRAAHATLGAILASAAASDPLHAVCFSEDGDDAVWQAELAWSEEDARVELERLGGLADWAERARFEAQPSLGRPGGSALRALVWELAPIYRRYAREPGRSRAIRRKRDGDTTSGPAKGPFTEFVAVIGEALAIECKPETVASALRDLKTHPEWGGTYRTVEEAFGSFVVAET